MLNGTGSVCTTTAMLALLMDESQLHDFHTDVVVMVQTLLAAVGNRNGFDSCFIFCVKTKILTVYEEKTILLLQN
jgi:hypothetical protein